MSPTDAEDLQLELTADDGPKWPALTWDLELRQPIELPDGTKIDRLQLREPTCQEWEEIQAHPVASRRRYAVSRIAGVPMGTVAKIGIGDVVRGEEYVASFFDVGQSIGGW